MQHSHGVYLLGGAAVIFGSAFALRVFLRIRSGVERTVDRVDTPNVIVLPPLIFLGSLALAALLEAILPFPLLPLAPAFAYGLGALLVLGGLILLVLGGRRFVAAGTNIPPTLPTTALVVTGPYRWSRNPLYLAMILVYVGLAIAALSLWTLLLAVPLILLLNYGVIIREEAYLERKFGADYRAYRARVRRWV
ncbi:MAG TPA: methyltransferase [Stellaceae bacterium]|nr:methyltransferase [Stellaceae bacterium]